VGVDVGVGEDVGGGVEAGAGWIGTGCWAGTGKAGRGRVCCPLMRMLACEITNARAKILTMIIVTVIAA
jgi:hypothetical protein